MTCTFKESRKKIITELNKKNQGGWTEGGRSLECAALTYSATLFSCTQQIANKQKKFTFQFSDRLFPIQTKLNKDFN